MALAAKRGEGSAASPQVAKLAEGMSEEKLREFAKVKRKKLPRRVKAGEAVAKAAAGEAILHPRKAGGRVNTHTIIASPGRMGGAKVLANGKPTEHSVHAITWHGPSKIGLGDQHRYTIHATDLHGGRHRYEAHTTPTDMGRRAHTAGVPIHGEDAHHELDPLRHHIIGAEQNRISRREMGLRKAAAGDACPSCGALDERGDDGNCNRCGKPWPMKKAGGKRCH